MNNDKAREYFSAYAEGTLEPGLAQSFEAKLKADGTLKAEYEQFQSTLEELNSLRFEEIEVPFDLNDRISAAIDKSIYDKKRAASPGWTTWLRNLAFGGLAAAAIFGAYFTVKMANGSTSMASVGTIASSSEQIQYSPTDQGIEMKYRPSESHKVTIRGGSDGDESVQVGRNGWVNELTNAQPSAAIFKVQIQGDTPESIVVVPGTQRSKVVTGQGSIVDLAKAVANRYDVPVILEVANPETEVSWNFGNGDAPSEAAKSLSGLAFSADMRETGVLSISDN